MFRGTIRFDRLSSLASQLSDNSVLHASDFDGIDVRPFKHPFLETAEFFTNNEIVFLSREYISGAKPLVGADSPTAVRCHPDFLHTLVQKQKSWPLDYQAIHIDLTRQKVSITAGHGGVAPLFVWRNRQQVTFSWDQEDLIPNISFGDLSKDFLALQIIGCAPYSAETAYCSIKMLTERAKISVDASQISVQYPEPAPYYVPIPLRSGADVPGAYADLLRAVLSQRPLRASETVAELSGGLDSGLVSVLLADQMGEGFRTCALEVEGAAWFQQQSRRKLLVDLTCVRDTTVPVGLKTAVPSQLNDRTYFPSTYNADYQRALRTLFSCIGLSHGTSMFTGTGGDELLMKHHFEQSTEEYCSQLDITLLPRQLPNFLTISTTEAVPLLAERWERAPFSVLPVSVLEAFAARAPIFLRRGCWPVSPLAHPDVIEWCSSLPLKWRANKLLHKETLRRMGVSDNFFRRPLPENFLPYLYRSALATRRSIAEAMSRWSALAELDLIDVAQFAERITYLSSPEDIDRISDYYHVYNAESMARRLALLRASDC